MMNKSMIEGVDYVGVAVVFFCHDGKGNVLLNKRSKKTRDEHGTWDPGGGKIEFGESAEQTLVREVKEEYCTDVIKSEFLGFRDVKRVDHDNKNTHWIILDFKVFVDKDSIKNGVPEKHEEIGWFSLDSLPNPIHSQFPDFIKRYRARLEK